MLKNNHVQVYVYALHSLSTDTQSTRLDDTFNDQVLRVFYCALNIAQTIGN